MSDPCVTVQAELLALVMGSDECGVAEVCPSQSVRELIQRDANGSLPAIGIAYRGWGGAEDESPGPNWFYADTRWEIGVVDRNGLSRASALESVMEIFGRIRARVHGSRSAVAPTWTYEAVHEETEDVEDDAVAGIMFVELRVKFNT
ncbi:MAG: hypothetical protein Q8P41_31615 [Pseudomonadota bacterium]|nr:hypothetical protein [Pseudomonadota bacterium]